MEAKTPKHECLVGTGVRRGVWLYKKVQMLRAVSSGATETEGTWGPPLYKIWCRHRRQKWVAFVYVVYVLFFGEKGTSEKLSKGEDLHYTLHTTKQQQLQQQSLFTS